MKCPQCQQENDASTKFCEQCAVLLAVVGASETELKELA
jgi:predicted amidophosphoribosyltransferase